MDMQEPKITKYNYETTLNLNYWHNFLGRELTQEEFYIIKEVKAEKTFNEEIETIHELAKSYNLCIPMLTNMHGNCVFESLQYHGLCKNIDYFRKGLAYLMILFKDKKNFFPNDELTPNEFFGFRNEIEHVFCRKQRKLYKYNFTGMCIDLANDASWTRLDTELILSFISFLFNVKINILHNNGHITSVCPNENTSTVQIWLALIDELHYIPLDYAKGNLVGVECPKYIDCLKIFHKWARTMATITGNVTYENEKEDD